MKVERVLRVVHYHALGHPLRIVAGGIPHIPGKTMMSEKEYFEKHFDSVRSAILQEPRGFKGMAGAVVTEPTTEDSSFGIIWMGSDGYFPMCGHGSLCVSKWAVENGIVQKTGRSTVFSFDTPAGLVGARVQLENGVPGLTAIQIVPSFYVQSAQIALEGVGVVDMHVAFGGDFFGFVEAKQLGIALDRKNVFPLAEIAMRLKRAATGKVNIQYPLVPAIRGINGIKILERVTDVPRHHYRGLMVFMNGSIDRTPCGTGAAAHLAVLYEAGSLGLLQETIHEILMGLTYKASIVKKTNIGHLKAVIREISGQAYLTGFSTFVIDEDDPVKYGFLFP